MELYYSLHFSIRKRIISQDAKLIIIIYFEILSLNFLQLLSVLPDHLYPLLPDAFHLKKVAYVIFNNSNSVRSKLLHNPLHKLFPYSLDQAATQEFLDAIDGGRHGLFPFSAMNCLPYLASSASDNATNICSGIVPSSPYSDFSIPHRKTAQDSPGEGGCYKVRYFFLILVSYLRFSAYNFRIFHPSSAHSDFIRENPVAAILIIT